MNMPWPFSTGFEFVKAKPYDAKAQQRLADLYDQAFRSHFKWGAEAEMETCRSTPEHGTLTWAEEKLDGWRVLIVKRGGFHVYSRGISKVTGLPIDLLVAGPGGGGPLPCVKALAEHLPEGIAFEGELYWPARRATEVPRALKSHREELCFAAFDLVALDGEPVKQPLWSKRSILRAHGIPLSRVMRIGDGASPVHTFANEALGRIAEFHKFEGLIVKASCLSEPVWYKVKCEATDDVVVLDTNDAEFGLTGKFAGLVGSLVVGVRCPDCQPGDVAKAHSCWELEGVRYREVANVSGMEDDERKEMTAQRESLYGRVCEVRFQKVGADKRLRHPRFIRWRDEEKTKVECNGLAIFGSLEEDSTDVSE